MRRSSYRRAAASSGGNRRMLAVGAVITALGAVVTFTTISNAATTSAKPGSDLGKVVNGQVILTDNCVDSTLPPHTGFQDGDRCVSTEFGEVGVAANNPSLLITSAPTSVKVDTPFTLTISTRNLIRDRFLAAGAGGYYVEASVLNNGIERGHFHTGCRMLPDTNEAPDPSPVPAFFVATEDGKGSATPDSVTISVPGLPTTGIAQCMSWAGDGSHRIPMMQRANQTVAADSVRITVKSAGGGNTSGGNTGGGATTPPTTAPTTAPATTAPATTAPTTAPATTAPTKSGGNKGGGTKGGGTTPTTAPATGTPTKAGSTTGATTKDDFTPNTTAPTTKSTPKAATTTAKSDSSTTTGTNNNDSSTTTGDQPATAATTEPAKTDEPATTATTKAAPKPKASSSKAAAGDYTYSNEDGVLNSGTKAPAPNAVAEPPASTKSSGPLSLVANNTVAFVGGGAVLLLIGLAVMALTRRRRPSSDGYDGWS